MINMSGHAGNVAGSANRRLLIYLITVAIGCLTSCQSRPYRPSTAVAVEDHWKATVASDGSVRIDRNVSLDEWLSVYFQDSTPLPTVALFGKIGRQATNACEVGVAHRLADVPISIQCSTTYSISAMPTVLQATLEFPDDLLFDFLKEGLAYQPLSLHIVQRIEVTVPGEIDLPARRKVMRFPVYVSRSVRASLIRPSDLRLESELILAPGDLVHPDMRRLDPIRFRPLLGMPE